MNSTQNPIEVTASGLSLSWQARTFNTALRYSVKPFLERVPVNGTTLHLVDHLYGALGAFLRKLPDFVETRPADFGHFQGEWLRAGKELREDKAMLYLHGGGYCFSSAEAHRPLTWRLSRAARRPVLAINYRQGPGYNIDHAREDALRAYEHLLERGYAPGSILIGGDSAGGHLALVTLQAIRDAGLPMPRAGMCFSPWTDLSCESLSYQENKHRDPMFPAKTVTALSSHFARDRDPYHPHVSPLHGDFSGLPPLLITVGSTEVLRDDARRATARAREHGVDVVYEEWKGMPHVFQLFAFMLPEGRAAYQNMARFIQMVERKAS